MTALPWILVVVLGVACVYLVLSRSDARWENDIYRLRDSEIIDIVKAAIDQPHDKVPELSAIGHVRRLRDYLEDIEDDRDRLFNRNCELSTKLTRSQPAELAAQFNIPREILSTDNSEFASARLDELAAKGDAVGVTVTDHRTGRVEVLEPLPAIRMKECYWQCRKEANLTGVASLIWPMIVCPDCGNKRCPKANDHRNACTDSNEPGQVGSRYESHPSRREMED